MGKLMDFFGPRLCFFATIGINPRMSDRIVYTPEPVTLVGGGRVSRKLVNEALTYAPVPIAADGGANLALRMGIVPHAVIGDFDSIAPATKAAIPADRLIQVSEQDSTDFEKCLSRVAAPFLLAVGFAAGRLDHALAVCSALIRHAGPPVIVLSETDAVFASPGELELPLAKGTRVSLFPLTPVTGRSEGLRWPIGGLDFDPARQIGTSNEAVGPVRLTFDAPGMLVILPRACLRVAIPALTGRGG